MRATRSAWQSLDLLEPQAEYSLGPEKIRFALYTQHFYSLLDSINVCQFVCGPAWQLYGPNQLVEMVRAVTGWDVSLWELMKVGERRLNLMRAFNAREGFTREHDVLPPKLAQPKEGGPSDGMFIDPRRAGAGQRHLLCHVRLGRAGHPHPGQAGGVEPRLGGRRAWRVTCRGEASLETASARKWSRQAQCSAQQVAAMPRPYVTNQRREKP